MNIPETYSSKDIIEFTKDLYLSITIPESGSIVPIRIERGDLGVILTTYSSYSNNRFTDQGDFNLVISMSYDPIKHWVSQGPDEILSEVITFTLNYSKYYSFIKKKPAAQVLYTKG